MMKHLISLYTNKIISQMLQQIIATLFLSCYSSKLRESSLDPSFSYHCSFDVQALCTSWDMRLAAKTAITSFEQNHGLLPSNLTSTTIGTLITFCLDNSYLEFNGCFYSQDEGGTMGSLLKPLLYLRPQILLHPTPTLLTTAAAHSETKIMQKRT